jgi:hypothetical protein
MMALSDIAFSSVLGLAAIAAALQARRMRAAPRDYLLLSAALYCALSLADILAAAAGGAMLALANAVTLIVCATAPVALALGVSAHLNGTPRNAVAIASLSLALCAGIAAAATGALALAFAPLFAAVCMMLAFWARAMRNASHPVLHGIVAALALLAGASAYLTGGAGGRDGMALFFAAALLGMSMALSRKPSARKTHARASKPSRAMPRPLP